MAVKKSIPEKGNAFTKLYPTYGFVKTHEAAMVNLPGSSGGYFGLSPLTNNITASQSPFSAGAIATEDTGIIHLLPKDRLAKYSIYETMAEDPTINCAIEMHVANALSAKSDNGEIFSIEPNKNGATNEQDELIEDLKNTLHNAIHEEVHQWAYKAAIYGTHFVRAYGQPGKGLTNLRSDFYTQPQHIKKYEKAGRCAGYTTNYQGNNSSIQLLPPWSFVSFEIPHWRESDNIEPQHLGTKPVDLTGDLYEDEPLCESQKYGNSLISTAYSPWLDLLEAIASLNMSRQNAAKLERIIGMNTGRLDPARAASFLDMIAKQFQIASRERAQVSLLKGNAPTVINHLVPIFGDTKGRLDINAIQGTPDINAIEDVNFHIKRLGAALGTDPSLLGFGDFLSGGLGDGGFFRMSVMAAVKANLLRQAVRTGINRLCEIHIAFKYNKIFLPGQQPWRIIFNSVSTAIEREEQENRESRANLATSLASVISMTDQESIVTDKRGLMHYLFTNILKENDETFQMIFPEGREAAQKEAFAKAEEGVGEF